MEKEPITPDFSRAKTDPFRVPEGYFDGLTDRIMAALPERPMHEEPPTVPLMDKVKPLLYLAAAFLGMMLLFKGLSTFRPATKGAVRPLLRATRHRDRRSHRRRTRLPRLLRIAIRRPLFLQRNRRMGMI